MKKEYTLPEISINTLRGDDVIMISGATGTQSTLDELDMDFE